MTLKQLSLLFLLIEKNKTLICHNKARTRFVPIKRTVEETMNISNVYNLSLQNTTKLYTCLKLNLPVFTDFRSNILLQLVYNKQVIE